MQQNGQLLQPPVISGVRQEVPMILTETHIPMVPAATPTVPAQAADMQMSDIQEAMANPSGRACGG